MAETPDSQKGGSEAEVESRSPETLVRRAALVLVLLLLVVAYALRSEDPGADQHLETGVNDDPGLKATPSSAPAPAHALTSKQPGVAPASDVAMYGERGLAEPTTLPSASAAAAPAASAPRGIAAVDLLEADLGGTERAAPGAPASGAAACGGLFVRLITHAQDKKYSFATIAKSFAGPAQVVHIGDGIAGFRVTGIEWDRVWVQSANERCAVGMHVGARGAQEQAEQQLSADQYARLPWVLPHAIVSGIDKRSEMEFELTESAIVAIYARGADLFAGLRVKVLDAAADKPGGLQLFDIRLDSFLERLGVEQGDVLVRIDEEPIASMEDVVQLLQNARDADTLVAGLLRDDEPYQLQLTLRGAE